MAGKKSFSPGMTMANAQYPMSMLQQILHKLAATAGGVLGFGRLRSRRNK
jgi:hypothetical protein